MQSRATVGFPARSVQLLGIVQSKPAGGLTQHDCVISAGNAREATRYVCAIMERSIYLGHSAMQISG